MTTTDYIRDGTAIYEKSFAIIRAEADLSRFDEAEADVAVRMIHACGMVEAARHFSFSDGFVTAARQALAAGASILCDAEMVAQGVTRGLGHGFAERAEPVDGKVQGPVAVGAAQQSAADDARNRQVCGKRDDQRDPGPTGHAPGWGFRRRVHSPASSAKASNGSASCSSVA